MIKLQNRPQINFALCQIEDIVLEIIDNLKSCFFLLMLEENQVRLKGTPDTSIA